jgi:hypothetical protein
MAGHERRIFRPRRSVRSHRAVGDRAAGRQQGHNLGGGVGTDSRGRTDAGTECMPIPPRWDATPLWQHALAAVIGPVLWSARGPGAAARFTAARFTAAVAVSAGVQAEFVAHLRGRLGAAMPSPADAVTLVRATSGATLLALVACGGRDGAGPSRRIAFALLLGAVASDWVDGPLARRDGPSRLGAVLDIEADSLLTLGGAAAATAWGGLSRGPPRKPSSRFGGHSRDRAAASGGHGVHPLFAGRGIRRQTPGKSSRSSACPSRRCRGSDPARPRGSRPG